MVKCTFRYKKGQGGQLPKAQDNIKTPPEKADSEVYRLYLSGKHLKQGYPWAAQQGTGRAYPDATEVSPEFEYQGDNHWNVKRFAYAPFFGRTENDGYHYNNIGIYTDENYQGPTTVPLEVGKNKKEQRKLLTEDMTKYYLGSGYSEEEALNKAKTFVKDEVMPLVNSKYHKMSKNHPITRVDQFDAPFIYSQMLITPGKKRIDNYFNDKETLKRLNEGYFKSGRKIKRLDKDFNIKFRGKSKEEAKAEAKNNYKNFKDSKYTISDFKKDKKERSSQNTLSDGGESLFQEYQNGGSLPKAQDSEKIMPTYLPDKGGYRVPVDLETGNIKGGILPEVKVSGKATPLVRYKRAYETNNPYDAQQYATDLFNNPKSREEYFDRFNKDRFFQKYGQRGYNEFQDNAWKYAAEQRMSQLPQGNRSRIEYLNDLTAKEEELFKKYNPALQTTYSADFLRAINAKDRESYDQLKDKLYYGSEKDLYTKREKQKMLQKYEYFGGVHGGDALAPFTWMSKPIQSIYRGNYSPYDALVGRKNDATIVEDIFTDPTLIYGLGKSAFNLGAQGLKQIGKYATTNTPLRNAYKLNPLANRAPLYSKLPQVDEPIRNVITGEATKIKNISNQVEAYTLKNGANPDVIYDAMKGSKFADDLVKDGRFEVNPELTQKFYGNNTQYANIGMTSDVTGKGELPISFKSLYEGGYRDKNIVHGKPHWLRGYEPIKEQEVLKQLPGSPNTGITSNVDDLVDLYRIQEKSGKTFAQLAAENKIPKAFNTPKVLAQKANEEKYFGQWFTKDKADLDWYMKDRDFVDPEIINLKVPKSKLNRYSNYDKSLSRAPDREFVVPLNEQGLYKQPNTSKAASIDNVGKGFGLSIDDLNTKGIVKKLKDVEKNVNLHIGRFDHTNLVEYDNGLRLHTYSQPGSSIDDVILMYNPKTKTNENIAYIRKYKWGDNFKKVPTNEWHIKANMPTTDKELVKFANKELEKIVPIKPIKYEGKTISTDGLKYWNQQTKHGYSPLDDITKPYVSAAGKDDLFKGLKYNNNNDAFEFVKFANKEDATEGARRLEDFMKKSGNDYKVIINNDNSLQINLPKLQRAFKDGGSLPKAQEGKQLPTYMLPEVEVKGYSNATPQQLEILRSPYASEGAKAAVRNELKSGIPFMESTKRAALMPFEFMGNMAAEASGVPSAYRIGKQIKKEGVGSAAKDVGLTLESVLLGTNPYSNIIPSPKEDYSGLGTTMDVATVLPYIGLAGRGLKQLGTTGLNNFSKSFVLNLDDVGKQAFKPTLSSKPLSVSNKAASSVDNVGSGFKSEINWGAWNKEIPENKALMDEYLAIEQKAKADGTWMKNPDGTPSLMPEGSKPTPELWIQSQSKNWEKAYGHKGFGNIDNTYRGVGITNTNPDFSVSSSPNLSGDRGIFTGDYDLASTYAHGLGTGNPKILTPFSSRQERGIFHLMHPKGKQIDYNTMLSHWTDVNLVKGNSKLNLKANLAAKKNHYNKLKNMPDVSPEVLKNQEKLIVRLENYLNDFDNIITDKVEFDKMRAALGDITTTDDIAAYLPSTDLNKIKLRNIIDGNFGDVTIVNNKPGNYLKSAIGNNGMFDMTNPNIYKSVAPLVGAGVVGSQYFSNPQEQVEYRNGGSLPKYLYGGGLPKYQDNLPTDKYGNPIRARIIEGDGDRTYYDDRTNTIVLNNDYDAMTPEEKKNVIAHENFHGFQFRNGMSTYLGDGAPIVRPPMMSTDEHYFKYHNRKPTEADMDVDNFIRANSDFRFVPRDLIFDKEIDSKNKQYNNPYSMEGQASYYEDTGQIFPFKDGGRLPMYQDGRTVSEIYEKITGLPWSTAKERGLTDGSYDANIKLRNQLLSQPLTQNPISYQNAPVIQASSFGEAFSKARNLLGAHRVFEYDGKEFATNVEGETGVVRTTVNQGTTVPTSTTGTTVNSGTTGTATNNTPSQSTQVAPIVLAPNQPEKKETPRYNEVSTNINPNSKLDPLNRPTAQDFRESVYNHYNTILKKNNNQFIHSTPIPYEGALNCINGVCSFYKEASPNIMERPYIGNLTFNDNAEREGWYRVDTDKDYEVLTGDMIRFTQPAWKYAESRQGQPGIDLMMESFEKNPETKNYPKVGHTSGVIKNSDGTYTILNNKGKADLLTENTTLEGVNKLVKEGRGSYDAAQIWRYDPAYIEKQKLLADTQTKEERNRTISYLKNFKKEPSFANKNIRPNIQPIIDAYVPMRRNLVANYGESDEFIDKAFQNLIGIAGQESNYDNRLVIQKNIFYKAADYAKQAILNNLNQRGNTLAKKIENLFLTDDKEYEINDDVPQWKRQKEFELLKEENFKNLNPEELKSDEQIWHDVYTKYGKVSADLPLSTKSKGMFKQKDVSKKFDKNYGNTDNWQYTQEGQIKNALGLYIENFQKAKRLFPNDNEEIWHKIATLAHNSPKSAYNKEYVDYFIKGIDNPAGSKSHYLSEVDRYRRIAFNDYSDYNNASSNDFSVLNMEPPSYYEQPSSTRVNINTYLNDLPPSQTMNIPFPTTIGNNIPPQNTQRMPIGLPSTSQTINTSNKLLPGQQQAQPPIFQDGGGCCGNKGGSNLQYLPEYLYGGRLPVYQDGDIKVPERKGVRKNPDGSESTHLMATETFDGDNWFSFPTLFQNEDGTWVDMSDRPWQEAYEEAKRRGEVIDFGKDKEAAIEFGEGSWKLPNYQEGGIPERYKNMGFNKVGAKKKSTRSGKKWMVLAKKGDKYKVVHGGDSNMKDFSQHGSKDRKEKFWSRMGGRNSAKAKDPFSPLYWHKRFGTWQEGGDIQQQGYKDTSPYKDNPYIDIYANPSTDSVNITTYGMSMDLKATPYYPNGEVGEPTILAGNSGNYNFEGASWVREEPAKGLLISEKGSKKVLDFFG